MRLFKRLIILLFAPIIILSCTGKSIKNENQVVAAIESRIGKEVYWNQSNYLSEIEDHILYLIGQPLTSEEAVQIALLHNPRIQATFEEIGIAQADLLEAGLLSNPAFEIEVRYPQERRFKTNIEYLITTAFLDIFLIPLRTKLASVELEQAELRVSHEILELAFAVRTVYYQLVAQLQKLHYTQAIVELTHIQQEIVSRQKHVGNINALLLQQIQAKYLESTLETAKIESEIISLRETLNKLLGFDKEICLMFPQELSEDIPEHALDLCILESLALQQRLDIQVARKEVTRIRRMLGLKEGWTYAQLAAGLAGERDPDGLNVVGYGIAGQIPLFNYGQAARMRLFAQLRQAQNHLSALEIQALSEVREAHKLILNDLRIIDDYRDQILPLQTKIVISSEELYNVMGMGIEGLLESKRQEFEVSRRYLEALRDYWLARSQLDKSLGGYLFLLLANEERKEQ